MKNNYRIQKIDPLTYTEEDWNNFFDFRMKVDKMRNTPSAFDTMEVFKRFTVQNMTENEEERFQVWKNDEVNNIFLFFKEFKDDEKKRFSCLANYLLDKKLDDNILRIIFEKFLDYDKKSNALAIDSKDGQNDFVAELYNAQVGAIAETFELNIKEANEEKINNWLAEAPSKFPDLRIEFYKDIPDGLLEEYAAFFTQMMEDLPANQEIGDTSISVESIKLDQEVGSYSNYCSYRYLIFNKANELIAMTNVSISLIEMQVMDQYMTGVHEKYRGLGISKWLKAAMFKKLVADFPELEKIKTDTHPLNHASRELSKQMGYKKVGLDKFFLIDRDFIVKYLDKEA